MSVISIPRPLPNHSATSAWPTGPGVLGASALHLLALALREIRLRRDMQRLSEFDDHMLRDIGLSRTDIEGVVRNGRGRP